MSASVIWYYMSVDYLLYEGIVIFTEHKDDINITITSPKIEINHEKETGVWKDLYTDIDGVAENMTDALDEGNATAPLVSNSCWPTAVSPDDAINIRINVLLVYCLVTILIEAYTARTRHVVCD